MIELLEKTKDGLMRDEREYFSRERLTMQGIRAVRSFLFKIGLYSNLLGFDYLICAVTEVCKNPRYLHCITKQLYPAVATYFHTTPMGVERNIRNAIETAFNRGKLRDIANTYYGANFSKYEKPTNGEFISFITDIAKNNCYANGDFCQNTPSNNI